MSLFIPSKAAKRSAPDNRIDDRSPPPPPPRAGTHLSFGNGSRVGTGPQGGGGGGTARNQYPPTRTPAPALSDGATKAKLASILAKVLELFTLELQTPNSAAGGRNGLFEMSDLAEEEAEELKRMWEAGSQTVAAQLSSDKEKLGLKVAEEFGALLAQLLDGAAAASQRDLQLLMREIEALKPNRRPSSSSFLDEPAPTTQPLPLASSSAVQSRPEQALSKALARIHALEQQLQQSDEERAKLRQDLDSQQHRFEQRLSALENRTTDPRRRLASTNGGNESMSPALTSQATSTGEFEILRKEVDQLKDRVSQTQSELGKRKREEEDDEGRIEKVTLKALTSQVSDHTEQLRNSRIEAERFQESLRAELAAFELPIPSHPSHPSQLLVAVASLSNQLSRTPGISELDSNLLRALEDFLATVSTAPLDPLEPARTPVSLRDCLVEMHRSVEALRTASTAQGSVTETHTKQLNLLRESLSGLKPFSEYVEKLFPELQKRLSLCECNLALREAEGGGQAEDVQHPSTAGTDGTLSLDVVEEEGRKAVGSGDQARGASEEEGATVARQLLVNGHRDQASGGAVQDSEGGLRPNGE